jgi:hypothetical protein
LLANFLSFLVAHWVALPASVPKADWSHKFPTARSS